MLQICLALKHAHDRRILHRDLKPQNIFLTRKNFVRLGDFGISRVLSNTLSVASTCVGTPLYLAPELCEGKDYDGKSDVWSLGGILFELCMLRPPFTANTMPALVMRICNDPLPAINGAYCDETKELAAQLLRKDPAQRPRVHDILAMGFIKRRIEQFLDPDALIDEFSHTVIREAVPNMTESPKAGAPSQDAVKSATSASRPKPIDQGTSANAPSKVRGKCAPPAGSAAARRASGQCGNGPANVKPIGTRRSSPGPRETTSEETGAQRAQRLRGEEDRRIAMREQIKRDRLAYARTRGKAEPTAAEIVERTVTTGKVEDIEPGSTSHSLPLVAEISDNVRRALEAAFPRTRLLTQEERRMSHDSLLRRQHEVVSRVQNSQLKGEAGRMALNEAQRELLDISRIRAATSKRYVLLHSADSQPTTPLPGGTVIAGVPIEEIGHINEDDADVDDTVEDEHGTEAIRSSAGVAAVDGLSRTIRADEQISQGDQSNTLEPNSTVSAVRPAQEAERRQGGIKFDLVLENNPQFVRRPSKHDGRGGTTRTSTPSTVDASTTLNVPAQLFGVGRPLANKVERLRSHLEDKLGGKEAFDRVYEYVGREESGEHQSGEREEILAVINLLSHSTCCMPLHVTQVAYAYFHIALTFLCCQMCPQFMADRRDLLPLVHTLLYLEEALDVRA